MAKNLNELVIVDVEATCWKERKPPPNQISEIIEVGICIFNLRDWTPVSKHQIIVKPTQSTVSQYCTDLTGWTQEALDKSGILLVDACNRLTSVYNTRNRLWASWGDYDRIAFERETKRKDIKYPFSASHINLKHIFAIHHNLKKPVGMKDALRISKLELEGKHHVGSWDAWNIGRVLEKQGRF